MAKDKEFEASYKAEGRRRIHERYINRRSAGIAKRILKRNGASWYDSSSPTGYRQNCEMGGTCQSPCNGDC